MTMPLPPAGEPPHTLGDLRELADTYLDYYRAALLRKLDGLDETELRTSRVPSGWTPLELVRHLTRVEARWFRWGFEGEAMPPERAWGDRGPDGRWQVPEGETAESVRAAFTAQCERSREIASGVPSGQRARTGGRFATEEDAPTLGWILFHVLQEYARHVGQLDVVRELADGATGE
ncbi:DinB family protein [Streptomyces varsoviensis]|uniref:Mini-circle protein n=1 Tax=Streptomyces varsoviensis TaxID=67373 RepID=A0ABR5J4V8_9ACTN|nr:DinB family protein [Streptomyces varsoviensis]KOG88389.1 Mini-circle protein [Streptomyces varsoviensis]